MIKLLSTPLSFATYSDLSAAVAANGGQSVGAVVNAGGAVYAWDDSANGGLGAYVLAGTSLFRSVAPVYERFAYIPDWTPNTVYYAGMHVKNNGNIWVCVTVSGTSGATFPSSAPSYYYVADNNLEWMYYQPVNESDFDGTIESVAVITGGSPPTTSSTQTTRLFGNSPTLGGIISMPYKWATGGVWGGLKSPTAGCPIKFYTDAKRIVFTFTNYGFQGPSISVVRNGIPYRIPYNTSTSTSIGGKSCEIIFNSRELREFIIRIPDAVYDFHGITVDKYATFYLHKNESPRNILLFGDSFVLGSSYNPTSLYMAIDVSMSRALGCNVFRAGGGGTGYVTNGPSQNFLAKLQTYNLKQFTHVMFLGGINDVNNAQLSQNADDCFRIVKESGAKLIVGGSFWAYPSTSFDAAVAKDAVLKSACDKYSGTFVELARLPTPPIVGTGNVYAPNNTGSGDIYRSPVAALNGRGADGTHPMALGCLSITQAIIPQIVGL